MSDPTSASAGGRPADPPPQQQPAGAGHDEQQQNLTRSPQFATHSLAPALPELPIIAATPASPPPAAAAAPARRPGVGFSATVHVRGDSYGGAADAGLEEASLWAGNSPVLEKEPSLSTGGAAAGPGRGSPPSSFKKKLDAQQASYERSSPYGAPPPPSTEFDSASLYRPGYARSESEASSISMDEMGDDEDVLYDWSGEEDLADAEAKAEEKLGIRHKKKKGWGPWRLFKALFSTVIGSTFLSGVIIAIPLCVNFLWYKKNPTDHRKYVSDNVGAWFYFVAFNTLVSWYLAVLIDLVPVVIMALVRAIWGEVTEAMKIHVETYGVVKGWIKPIFYAASMWGSWAVIFQQIYHLHTLTDGEQPRAPYTKRLYQVIEFLFFLMLIFCVCKILLQFIALSFHRVAFKDRLTEIEFNVAVLDRLNLYRPKTRPSRREREQDGYYSSSGYGTPKDFFGGEKMRKVSPGDKEKKGLIGGGGGGWKSRRNSAESTSTGGAPPVERSTTGTSASFASGGVHAYPPSLAPRPDPAEVEKGAGLAKFAGSVGRNVRKVALHDARNVKRKQGKDGDDELTSTLNSAKVAKKLARDIYKSYRARKRPYLLVEDFYVAFDTIPAAEAAFKIFDADGNGDISRSEIKSTVMRTYKERRFLAKALQDVDQAVGSLENVLLFFGAVILFFVALSIFGVKIGTQITSLYTLLIGLSFIFKSAAGNAFDSIIFLFVTHPFDTGDRVFIGTENLVVKRMGIWSTNFVRVDGTEAYYYNSVLFNLFIINVRRSGPMFENMTVQVGWDTTNEQIDELERRINNWLAQDETRDIASSTAIMYQHIDFQRSITLTIGLPHIPTWQDWGGRITRRTRFHAAVKFYMEQLEITYKNSPQPVRFVTADGQDAFPPPPSPPQSALDGSLISQPPASPAVGRKVSMSQFRRPSMGIPHPGKPGEEPEEPIRPALGFLPTAEDRGAGAGQQMRRRRARSKKQWTIAG